MVTPAGGVSTLILRSMSWISLNSASRRPSFCAFVRRTEERRDGAAPLQRRKHAAQHHNSTAAQRDEHAGNDAQYILIPCRCFTTDAEGGMVGG